MRITSALRLLALTLAFAVGFAAAGSAEDADKAAPPPVPDKGTTSQLNCLDEASEYIRNGNGLFYVLKLENKCEARMRCTVFAYQLNARGPAHGHGTVTLGRKSAGAAAKQSYRLKIKGVGGFGTTARECRAI